MGIDPGIATTGYGVITYADGVLAHVAHGCITTPAKQVFRERLLALHRELKVLVRKYRPDAVAVEELFFAANAKTAFAVGQARGCILLTCAQARLSVSEHTPLQVKQALTGYGRADKRQIQEMVKALLHLRILPQPDDAADALAIAITAAHTQTQFTEDNQEVPRRT